jgi:hypothetical protein
MCVVNELLRISSGSRITPSNPLENTIQVNKASSEEREKKYESIPLAYDLASYANLILFSKKQSHGYLAKSRLHKKHVWG